MRTSTHDQVRARQRRPRLEVWPLRTEKDYKEMRAAVDRLILDVPEQGPMEDRLEVMLSLMEVYEDKHHRLNTSDKTPLDTLKFLMERREMSPSDLGRILGDRSIGRKILTGERKLSKSQIKKLSQHFHVSADLFL